MMTSW